MTSPTSLAYPTPFELGNGNQTTTWAECIAGAAEHRAMSVATDETQHLIWRSGAETNGPDHAGTLFEEHCAMTTATQLVDLPADDANLHYEQLGYLEAYDAVNDDDYAFLAWRETERSNGDWRVRIKARGMAGVVFEPEQMRKAARAASAQGKQFFTWGAGLEPSAGDPRQIEFRVHVANGRPSEIEILVVLRKFDHSADAPHALRFAWPG